MSFFFFNDTATTEISTLSLHDALPISRRAVDVLDRRDERDLLAFFQRRLGLCDQLVIKRLVEAMILLQDLVARLGSRHFGLDRKSTRLNSSHANISYAVFCLKKKKTKT